MKAEFAGKDLEAVVREFGGETKIDWAKSTAEIEFRVDADHRLRKFLCRASLTSANPALPGVHTYAAEVEVVSWNADQALEFRGADGAEIPLSGEIRRAVDQVLGGRK